MQLITKNDDTGNYSFRGNNPLNGSDEDRYFDYDDWVDHTNNDVKENWYDKLPKDFYLIDVSLLNLSNSYDLRIERKYFKENSDKGEFINWP